MKFFYSIKRVILLPFTEKLYFIIGIILSLYFIIVISYFPLKFYKHKILKKSNRKDFYCDPEIYSALRKSISRVNRFVPWNTSCLSDALVLKYLLLLNGINSRLAFVVKKNDGMLYAHAHLIINENFTYLKNHSFFVISTP